MTDPLKSLHMSPVHGLVYANNQKAGCTSVKYSLWRDHDRRAGESTFKGKTHDRAKSPFLIGLPAIQTAGREAVKGAHVFALVRNPYARALSAYLHHIADDSVWVRITRRLGLWRSSHLRDDFMGKAGLKNSRSLSFEMYLDAMLDVGAEHMVGHFRPQVVNLHWKTIKFDTIFDLSDGAGLEQFFDARDIPFRTRTPHAQKADQKLKQIYTQSLQRKLDLVYAQDFEAFGYREGDLYGAASSLDRSSPDAKPLADVIWS